MAVGVVQAVADLGQDLQQFIPGQGAFGHEGLEAPPFHVLHGQEEDPVLLPELIDRDDARVVEDSRGPGLPLEPVLEVRPFGQLGADGLDGHLPADGGIEAQVDLPHGAFAQHPLDGEFSQPVDHRRPSGVLNKDIF